MPSPWLHNPPRGQVNVRDSVAGKSNTLTIQEAYLHSPPSLHPPPTAYIPRPPSRPSADISTGHQAVFETRSFASSDAATDSTISSVQKDPLTLPHTQFSRFSSDAEWVPMENGSDKAGGTRPLRAQSGHQPSRFVNQRTRVEDSSTIYRYIEEHDVEMEDHVIGVLMWLSFLDPFMSFICAIFAVGMTIVMLLTSPIRLCRPACSPSISIIRAIAPLFRHHLKLMYAPSVEDAHTFDFSPVMLVLTQVVSPLLSVGVMVAAWISAAFWLFALMMGNPDGTERSDDGRAAVLAVRNWWESFQLYALR